MRPRSIYLLPALLALAGCTTHLSLRNNTVRTTDTLTDLNYRQVLDNLALFSANAAAMPAIAVINAGTVTVADQKSVNFNSTYAPTITQGQQAGSGLPILSLLFNPSVSRTLTENWSLAPVIDVDNLRRIRCAFQLLVLRGGTTSDCDQCDALLRRFYLGEAERIECLIPLGWYRTGCKKEVPRDACAVGHYGNLYVWVGPEGLEGLTRFTMTVIDLATGKPHAPTKTVVQTFKGDGTLDNTQVTTTEIDRKALNELRYQQSSDRPRQYVTPPAINPGLFFVPR
jgi:hypothetical protein